MQTLLLVLVIIGVVNAAGKCNCGQYGQVNNQVVTGQNFRGINLPAQLPGNVNPGQGNFGIGGNNVGRNTGGKWFGKTKGGGGIAGGQRTDQIIDTGGLVGPNGQNVMNGAGQIVNNVATINGGTVETVVSSDTRTSEVSNGGMTGSDVVTQNGGMTTGIVNEQNGGTSGMNEVNGVSSVNGGMTSINGNGVSSQTITMTSSGSDNGVVTTNGGQTSGGMSQADLTRTVQTSSTNGGEFNGNGATVGIGGINQEGMTNGNVQRTSVPISNKRILKTFGRRMPSTGMSESSSVETGQTFNGGAIVNGVTTGPTVNQVNGAMNDITNQFTNTEQSSNNFVNQNGNMNNGDMNNQVTMTESGDNFVAQNGNMNNGGVVNQGTAAEQMQTFVNHNGNQNNGGFVNAGVAGIGSGIKHSNLNNVNMPTMNIPRGKQPQYFETNTGTVSGSIMGLPQQGPGLKKQGMSQSGQGNIGVGGFSGQNIAHVDNNMGIPQQGPGLNQQTMNQVEQNIVNGGFQGQGSGNEGMVPNQGFVPDKAFGPNQGIGQGGYGGQQPVIVKTVPGTGGIGGVVQTRGHNFRGLRQQAYSVIKIIQSKATGNKRHLGNRQLGPGFNKDPRGNMFNRGNNAGYMPKILY